MNQTQSIKALRDALADAVEIMALIDVMRHLIPEFPALDNARKVLALTADASEDAPYRLPIPRSSDEAAHMVNIGTAFLRKNAPEYLHPVARPAPVGAGMAVDLEAMHSASRVVVSTGYNGMGQMIFTFKTLAEMHRADDEWRALSAAPAAPVADAEPTACDMIRMCQAADKFAAEQAKPEATLQTLADQAQELGMGYAVKPWEDRMGEHYGSGGKAICHPQSHFMKAEIADWRAASVTHKGE